MNRETFTDPLVRDWGSLVLQGAVAILFGLMFLIAPVTTLAIGVYLFGAFALADGVLAVFAIFAKDRTTSAWLLAVYGVLGITVGLIAFLWPAATIGVFLALVAVWAFVVGVLRVAAAIALRKEIRGEWVLAVSGVFSILFGLYVLFVSGSLRGLLIAIGVFAIIKGVLLIAAGIRLRSLGAELARRSTELREPPAQGPSAA